MDSRLLCVFVAIGLSLSAHTASAQTVEVGSYVRISYDCERIPSSGIPSPAYRGNCPQLEGPIAHLTSDSLYLGGRGVGVHRATIQTLEVRTHRNRRWLGAGLGLLIGTAAGFGVTYIGGSSCSPQHDFDCLGWVLAIPLGAVIGTVGGITIGGGERWQQVSADVSNNNYLRPVAMHRFGLKIAF